MTYDGPEPHPPNDRERLSGATRAAAGSAAASLSAPPAARACTRSPALPRAFCSLCSARQHRGDNPKGLRAPESEKACCIPPGPTM